MREIKLYECSFCHVCYNEKRKAEVCEASHKKSPKVKDCIYPGSRGDRTGAPQQVLVLFDDGSEFWYRR